MRGASLPPYGHEPSVPPGLPSARPPLASRGDDELAEHLSLPAAPEPRADGQARARSSLDVRLELTHLARELGTDYRLRRGIELRLDLTGLEAMQAVLLESFPDGVVRTVEEAHEVRRHGAVLSELLARRLGAEWIDVAPEDPGRWAMFAPPDLRVWPFGRLARLIAMGHRERDLVSYFLELEQRALRDAGSGRSRE